MTGVRDLAVALAVTGVLVAFGKAESQGLQLHHIHGLAVDPGDSATVYIATHGGIVKGSHDRDWEFVGDDRSDFMGFTIHPTVPGLMVASGHPGAGSHSPNPRGVIVSRDGGRTWRALTLGGMADFHALALSRADGDTLYGWNVGSNPGLYRISLQKGSWSRVEARGLADVFTLGAHPTEPHTVVAGTRSGLLVSRDGGRSWDHLGSALRGVPVTAVAFHPESPRLVIAYAVHRELGLIQSSDGGLAWVPLGLFLGKEYAVSHVAFRRAPGAIYLATFRSDVYRSTDGGRRWERLIESGRPATAGSLRTEIEGVRVELTSEPNRPVQGRETVYTLSLRDQAGQPMTGARVTLMGRMPDGMTVLAPLRPGSEPGIYRGRALFTMEGRWDLTLRVSGQEKSFELSLTEQVGH